jgi:glycosyltransferase involved in cell wall biosynthesis
MIDAATHLGVRPDRLLLLPRGVDLDRCRPGLDTAGLRRRLRIDPAAPVILSPRYQVDERLYNLDVVIDAFRRVQHQAPDAVCVQLYEPSREVGRSRLEGLAAERGLGDGYRLVPAVDNAEMAQFYNLADVVVSVPSSDGFPVTVLEASACATPLVVSDLPYCAEWFENGVNGMVVPVGDAGAVADAVVTLLRDPERRSQMGAAARRLVEQRADYQRCMDELENVYRTLLAAGGTRRKDT